jgi:hypothetical protein
MMALTLSALLLVPLLSGVLSLVGSADAIRGKTADLHGSLRDSEIERAWEWGEAVCQAWWRPGPTLHLRTRSDGGADYVAGVWADGWFLGEWKPRGSGEVEVAAPVWADLSGDELTVRVRQGEEQAWGPPWRLIVPNAGGQPVVPASINDGASVDTVVHVPALGNPGLGLSWTGAVPPVGFPGLPFILPTPGDGAHEIELDDRKQSWKTETSRDLDIYF